MFDASIDQVRVLRAELADACAALDPTNVTVQQAHELVAEGHRISRLALALTTRFAIAAAADGAWARSGHRSPAEQYAAAHDITKSEAVDLLTLAGQSAALPALAAAIAEGGLSAAQAKAIGSAGEAAPDAVEGLLELASRQSLGELNEACSKVKTAADPDPETTRARIRKARSLRSWVKDGVGHIHLTGPAEDTARIMNKLRTGADRTFRTKRVLKEQQDTPDVQLYDAAVETILSGASGVVPKAGADAKVILRADIGAWLRGYPSDGEVCEIAGIGPVPVSVLDEWLPHAFVALVLTDGVAVGNVTHLGRRFTTHQRTALQWRDPQCAAAGCTNTHRLEYDHDTGWAVTRTTVVDDADRLCPRCHRKKTIGWALRPPDEHGQRHLTPPPGAPPDPSGDVDIGTEFAAAVAAVRARSASAA